MKAITVLQPWATLIAIGAKRIETHSWNTNYRGPLAIHAGKRWSAWRQALCHQEPCRSALSRYFDMSRIDVDMPRGAVVAVAHLTRVFPVERLPFTLTEQERAFGDFSPGRYAWLLENVQKLPVPLKAKGAPGLWDWDAPAEVAELVKEVNP